MYNPRLIPLPWNENKAKLGQKLRIGWYDNDGNFEPTPGMKRAVSVAIESLRSNGHQVVPFRPPNLTRVNEMGELFMAADERKGIKENLKDSPVDQQAMGYRYNAMTRSFVVRKIMGWMFGRTRYRILNQRLTVEQGSR